MTASKPAPARLPEGTYRLKPEYFRFAIQGRVQVQQTESGYLINNAPAKRSTVEKYYEFAHA